MTNEELRKWADQWDSHLAWDIVLVLDENDRMREALTKIRDWSKLPLIELTDTDEERATAYRARLNVHAHIAKQALK